MRSIRRTLGLRLAAVALCLLLPAAACLYAGVRWMLTSQFDSALSAKLASFTTLIEQEGDYVELSFVELAMPEFSSSTEPEYLELWLADRADDWVLYRSPSLGEGDLPRLGGTEERPAVRHLELPDGRAGRAIGAEFTIHHHDPGPEGRRAARVALVLAKGTMPLDRALGTLLAGTVSAILLLLGAGSWLGGDAVRRGLRPLEELARQVGVISDPARAPRFDARGAPAELVPLIESHELLLGRIRAALERERRTAANIAHELRTPVAELLLLAETAQHPPADPAESTRRLGELREIGLQMSGLIATLLELARLESGQTPLEFEAVDLAEMVRDCWDAVAVAADAKGQVFRPPQPGPLVRADRMALSILLANLLRNAVDHAPAGDQICCRVENGGERCRLVLSNAANGPGLLELDEPVEPSRRAGPAREDQTHAGIGLSLARRLAEVLAADLSFELEHGVFRARLSLAACGA